MNLGQLREATKHLPDDAEILCENEEPLQYYSVELRWKLEPILEHPWAVLLEPGECLNHQLDLDARIDAKLGS